MLLLLPILILLIVPLLMLVVRVLRPRSASFWLVAVSGGLTAWALVLSTARRLPIEFPLVVWQPAELFPQAPTLLADSLSWPFALTLVSLALAVILTDVVRSPGGPDAPLLTAGWITWAGGLCLTGLGLVGVLAGNPLTLLLAWAAIDLAELLILLVQTLSSAENERIVIAFSARVGGTVLLIAAGMAAQAAGLPLSFSSIPPQVSVYLLLAAGLRLGVLPINLPLTPDARLRHGLGTLLRLVPAAASLVLLVRVATVGIPANPAVPILGPAILAFAALAALYGSLLWAVAEDEIAGRAFWILGLAGLAVAAAVRGQPEASLAWSIALLLSGGLLFLASTRHNRLRWLLLLGLIGLSSLPYTPAAAQAGLYAPPLGISSLAFLLAQVLLLAGYVRHALRPGHPIPGAERWVRVIYPWGLALLPLAHILIAWYNRSPAPAGRELLAQVWPGLAALGMLLLLIAAANRGLRLPGRPIAALQQIFSFGWLYRLLWGSFHLVRRAAAFINMTLEGEGGLLWTLLLLTLLLSLFAQVRPGG